MNKLGKQFIIFLNIPYYVTMLNSKMKKKNVEMFNFDFAFSLQKYCGIVGHDMEKYSATLYLELWKQ